MKTSRRLLLYGLQFFWICCIVRGTIYVPPHAIHFETCNPDQSTCPANSACRKANVDHYCKCDVSFYNDKDRTDITYPGGECLVVCKSNGSPLPCACKTGSVKKLKENGLYICIDKCKDDSDCPAESTCKARNCYCKEVCKRGSKERNNCITLVKLDDVCSAPTTTISPLLTSNANMGKTSVYTQPVTNSTTSPLLTSSMTVGDTSMYTHQNITETHYNPFTTSTEEISVTSQSISQKTSEKPGALTPQPAPTTTISPLLTSNANMGKTSVYTQPVTNSTTSPLLTSSMTVGDTSMYTHQNITETHYNPFTTSTEEISVTSQSISQKTSEKPGALTPQPVVDRCEIKSKSQQEIEECKKKNNTGPKCTLLKSIVNIKEKACEKNNTNSSTNAVQKVADKITDLLNQTTLTKLNSSDLQTVVIAVIENVEASLLESFSTDLRNQQISTPEIEAEMKVSPDHCDRGSSIILNVHGNQMEVPCSLVNFEGGGAMLISYKGLNSRLNGSILAAFGDPDDNLTTVISPVVGGAITSLNTENLVSPVTFSLKHLTAVKPSYSLRCVFWDTKEEVWSTRGCETQQSERENSTICICTHLSTFAVIMAPTEIQVDTGLRLISIIGLSISLICLCLSFLTFLLCRSLRSAHTSILTVLCGCLFLGQLLVLVGLEQTRNKILCSVIAGSLQFLFLCAFCWMSLESILLFLTVRNLQAVNFMNSQRYHFPYVCLIGFGIPVIIMIVSASVFPDIYGGETHCWLKLSHIWSFLGPVCLFISVNFTLLVLTFWLLRKKLASLNANVSTLKNTRLLTFKAFSQLFILGCTWIIGLFQFGSGSIVVSYIFTICNSLQGGYIFLVHCLLNHQVREEYSRGFRRFYSKKSTSDTANSSTVQMTLRPSQASEAPKDALCSMENPIY